MPRAWLYGRHSTNKQGQTERTQRTACENYYRTRLAPSGVELAEPGWFYDRATSGGTRFSEREQGRLIFFGMERGDYLVVQDMSRLFRNRADGFATLEELDRKGIKRCILDLPDLTGIEDDVINETIEGQLVLFGHMYRRMLGRKMRADNEIARQNNLPFSRSAPIGWKIVGSGKARTYRVNQREREMVALMQTMADDGVDLIGIAFWSSRQGRKQFPNCRAFTTEKRVRWALRARLAGWPMITNIDEFSRQWTAGLITADQTLPAEAR